VNDTEEDWRCKVCRSRYNSEVVKGIQKKWIECDGCAKQFLYDCIPKNHRQEYGLDSEEDCDDELKFICHICVPDENEFSSDWDNDN